MQMLGSLFQLPEPKRVSGVSKRVRANVPAPKEEHSCQTSEMTKNDRAFIA
jgi:hypothetical protein